MAADIHFVVGRIIAQEVSIGVLRAIIAKNLAVHQGRELQEVMQEIAAHEQAMLQTYLSELEDKDPQLAALLDIRLPEEIASGLEPPDSPNSAA